MGKRKPKLTKTSEKPERTMFVIMPFTSTQTRNSAQLTAFFDNQIKKPVEKGKFKSIYRVRRSDETFDINAQIIKDLFNADIVLCDLSGTEANPNVMYELGIRLAFSNKPVILIREAHANNKRIFDIGDFYVQDYDPFNYAALTEHIRMKLTRFENSVEQYSSPVLKIIGEDRPLLQKLSAERAGHLLETLRVSLYGTLRLFCGKVDAFLRTNSKIKNFGDTPEGTLRAVEKNLSKLKSLSWKGFSFHLGSQPALDQYLATRYLNRST
ncbi:MAG: hypothetical protein HOP29_07275 [Phycisphaerales bacterium]|nr:hypothetical protein [Phycisphaerales bacterium]